jgi:glycosyltransferase involved in cell wall biosynthesis
LTDTARLPRKVLHVLNSSAGGAALSTLALIEAFRRHGIEAVAVSHDAGSSAEREALREATGGQVLFTPLYWWNKKIRNPLWKRPLSEARQILRTGWGRRSSRLVAEMAERHGVDLIHTNTLTTPEGGIAARQLGLPHVWHCRELVGPGTPYPLAHSGHWLGRYLVAHCSKLVANSRATAAQLAPWVPADLLEVVYNGIDLSQFTPRERPPRTPLVVGMVGNLTSHVKKHWLLIEAAGRVDRSLPLEWRIYGHDPSQGGRVRGDAYLDKLHDRLAELGLTERFKFPGLVPNPAAIMDEIDLLVHPADGESFGRIVVEAMAAGLPVVGVRGGGVGEIVVHEETGLLAPIDDPAALGAQIETLARDAQLRARLGQSGRRRAEERYSLESCVRQMLHVYQQALARPLSGGSASRDRSRGLNA